MTAVAKNVVLVHGAFADGSSWSKVIPFWATFAIDRGRRTAEAERDGG
jgi:hypothetical protein